VGWVTGGMFIILTGAGCCPLLMFGPSSMSILFLLELTELDPLKGLQYCIQDNQGIILIRTDPNPQNRKMKTISKPIPEIDPKFFIQLPNRDRKEMCGAS
jgi:hypothetical protein